MGYEATYKSEVRIKINVQNKVREEFRNLWKRKAILSTLNRSYVDASWYMKEYFISTFSRNVLPNQLSNN